MNILHTVSITNCRQYVGASLARKVVLAILFVLSIQSAIATAQEKQISEDYSMAMEPPAARIEIAQNDVQDIMAFFHSAERAIESENIDDLMTLYSDSYTNLRKGNKGTAREIWQRIFLSFNDISSRHSMKLIGYDKTAGQAITECSGLLSGTPEGEQRPVTIDRWDTQRHILVKEGYWKLFGNAGKSAERYGVEGAKMHPLF